MSDAWNLDAPLAGTVRPFWSRLPWYLPSLVAIGLGLSMLTNADLFASNPASWRIMAATFGATSQTVWGVLFLAVGAAHFVAKRLRSRVRWGTAFTLVALFSYLAATLTISTGFLSTGTIAYGGYAILAVWAVVRPQ